VTVLQKVEQKASSCGSRLGAIGLADTMGWASPLQIKRLVDAVRDRWPSTPITLHLHDTRALAIENVVAALEMGIDCYDSAVAGMGGRSRCTRARRATSPRKTSCSSARRWAWRPASTSTR
jgi:hydroxymethylglutaryl-CoA lyase